jgi:urease accessory protein
MSALALSTDDIPAGNRAHGRIDLAVAAHGGASRRTHVHESGSLRVRFPNPARPDQLEAVIVNTAGGMAGGDKFDIGVEIGAGARLVATTAAAEKIYRSAGRETQIAVNLDVAADGELLWLPQETIVFDQVRLRRSIDVKLEPGADLVLAEAVVYGRSAMGETVAQGSLIDRWRISVGGRLVFAETTRLEGEIARQLSRPASAAGGVATATVIKVPGSDRDVDTIRAALENCAGEAGASAWNGLAVVRLVAPNGAALRRDLVAVLKAVGSTPLPRLWLN